MAKSKRPKAAEVGPVRLTIMASRGSRDGDRWYWRARRKGERDTVWTGWATRDEAMAAVARLVTRGLPGPARFESRTAPRTIGELVERYLDYRKGHVWKGDPSRKPKADHLILPSSYYKYETSGRHIKAWLDDVPLGAVSSDVLTNYITNRRQADTKPARSDRTVERELALLRFAWIWARSRGWVTGELPRVMPASVEGYVNNHRTPRPDDARVVIALLPGDYRLAAELMAYCGARIREITEKLRLEHIDVQADKILIHGKRSTLRAIPISPWHRAELARRKAAGDPKDLLIQAPPHELEQRRGDFRGLYVPTFTSKLRRACKAAGVPVFTAHGLRRMVDTALYDSNVDPGTSGTILGHSPEVALRAYRQVRQARMRKALKAAGLDALLRPLEEGNVITLPGIERSESGVDLSTVSHEKLLQELLRRQQRDTEDSKDMSRDAAGA